MIELRADQYSSIVRIAEQEAGLYLPIGKLSFVSSRLQRRLRKVGIASFDEYIRMILDEGREGKAERRNFVSALTTNVTSFFREPHHFSFLADHLEEFLSKNAGGRAYRVWSAGCSTGEEALSIATTCYAILGPNWAEQVRIFATDVDYDIIDRVKDHISSLDISSEILQNIKYIDAFSRFEIPSRSDLADVLLREITFQHHNLMDPLEEKGDFDAIFCRNVTIYFSQPRQKRVHEYLRSRLAPGAMLAIGHSERLLGDKPILLPIGQTAWRRPQETHTANSHGENKCH